MKIIHAAPGGITESDVLLASASNAIIVGFNVRPERGVAEIAEREGVDLRLYTVIYQLLDEFKQAMLGRLAPEFRETAVRAAEVARYVPHSARSAALPVVMSPTARSPATPEPGCCATP